MDKKCSVKKLMGIWTCLVTGSNSVKPEALSCSRLVVHVNLSTGTLALVL